MADSDIRKNILGGSNPNDLDVQFIKQKTSLTGELVPTKVCFILMHVYAYVFHFFVCRLDHCFPFKLIPVFHCLWILILFICKFFIPGQRYAATSLGK